MPSHMAKSWRESSEKSPAHRYDIALTDHYAPEIQAALLELLDGLHVDDLIDKYGGSLAKAVDPAVRAALIAKIVGGIVVPKSLLGSLALALSSLYFEGLATGAYAARLQLEAHGITVDPETAAAVIDVDWDAWKPGDTIAVGEVTAGQLRSNLADLDITVKGISDTVLDVIGNHIGDGLLSGLGSDAIAREIRDLVGDSFRAERIAHTEVARAQTNASMLVYRASGVTQYELLLSDGACEECVDLAAANPWPIDDDSARVPIHPFCRCADAPVPDSIDPTLIEAPDEGSEP